MRFLDLTLLHPMAGLARAIEERGDLAGAEVLAGVEKAIAQSLAKQLAKHRDVAGESNQAISGKPALKGPLLVILLLPRLNPHSQSVLRGRKGTAPVRVISTIWVVREVEIEEELVGVVFFRFQVAASPVRFSRRRRVDKWNKIGTRVVG